MKSPTYTPEFRAALVTYRRRRSLRISENRRWLLEADVSTIDSTPQKLMVFLMVSFAHRL